MTNKEAINKLKDILEEVTKTDDSVCYVTSDDADALKAAIKALDIELLTDTEQRIFLTAMRRERVVCKTVDDTYAEYSIGSNVSLVEVCDSIKRKVKKIWE